MAMAPSPQQAVDSEQRQQGCAQSTALRASGEERSGLAVYSDITTSYTVGAGAFGCSPSSFAFGLKVLWM